MRKNKKDDKNRKKVIDKASSLWYNTNRRETQRDVGVDGSIAQLGEHLPYKQRVIGSSPIVPTTAFLCGTAR